MDPFSLVPQQRGQFVNVPPAPQAGGMFGGGKFGIAQAIAAALNGYLASQPGGAGEVGRNNLQMMTLLRQKQLEHQQELDDYNRKRADDNTDFISHRDYEIGHPMPQQPGEFEQALIASGVQPGTPEWTKAMQTRAQNMLDPVVSIPLPGGSMYVGPRSGMTQGAPSAPVGNLKPYNPGGPTPSASGGFSY